MMSFEECQEWGKKMREEKEALDKRLNEIHNKELKKMGINPDTQKPIKEKHDHPSMPENGAATILYVVAMIASLIFKDFWIAWIVLTVVYAKFITRHDND